MKKLLAICHVYVLIIGLTSYKLVNGRLRKTRMTQIYAWTVNIIILALLPYWLWIASTYASTLDIVPRAINLAPFCLNVVNYAVIVYTVARRSCRDRMLLDLQKLTIQLNRARTRCGIKTSLKLRRLLYLKIFTVVYQTLATNLVPFVYGFQEGFLLASVVLNFGYNTLFGTSYFCFMSFWHIAQGYDFINRSIEELITDLRRHSVSHLWKMHIDFSRTAQRINGDFETQVLALRINHFMFSVLDFYLIVHYLSSDSLTPWVLLLFGVVLHLIRMLDFYLNDYILDLTVEYHNKRKDSITEGTMSKEVLNAFILYENSMQLDLKVCGLFKANRNNWLQMAEGILCSFIVLWQFRLTYN